MPKDTAKWPGASIVTSLQKEVNHLFEGFSRKIPFVGTELNLLIDVIETAELVIVNAEIPGIDPKEVDISITGNTLTIKGEKKVEKEEKEKQYHRIERNYGSFARIVEIPLLVDAEKVKAEYKNGVLKITIPKSEKIKPKQITIRE